MRFFLPTPEGRDFKKRYFSMTKRTTNVDPRFKWLEEQEQKNTKSGDAFWLWDNDTTALFLFKELSKEGMFCINHVYCTWLSMMMKHTKEPYLSFIKDYIQTGKRKYKEVVDDITPFNAMRKYGDPYILAVFRRYYEKHPEIYKPKGEPEWDWDYDTMISSCKRRGRYIDLQNIVLNEDGTDYREMTVPETHIAYYYRDGEITKEEYDKIMGLDANDFLEKYHLIREAYSTQKKEWRQGDKKIGVPFKLNIQGII